MNFKVVARRSRLVLRNAYLKTLPINDPNFMVIGAQKSGTSSLHHYLAQHPQFVASHPKEVGFFHRDIHFGKTLNEYRKSFRGRKGRLHFESTPEYLCRSEVAGEIHTAYPNMKFIVLLREPGKRAYSAWNHYKDHFHTGKFKSAILNRPRLPGNRLVEMFYENRDVFPTFRECLEMELGIISSRNGFEPSLLRRGLYLEQLENYWSYFDRDNFLIIGFYDFVSDLESTLRRVTDFLGANPLEIRNLKLEAKNQRSYLEPVSEQDRALLDEFYEEPNKKLFEKIGHLNW